MKYVTLKELSNEGMFKDGDWIESKDQDKDGNVRLLQLADIGVGEFLDKSSKFINNYTFETLKCTEIKKGDILIARMPDPIGRACLFPIESSDLRYITAVDVAILRVNNNVDNRYVCYILNSPSMLSESLRQCTGATRKRISRSKLAQFQIPLPPLETQKKIAAILDEADKLRQLDKQLIEKYDELTQSLFLDMFENNNSEGNKIELGQVIKLIGGGTPSKKVEKYWNGDIPWASVKDLKSDRLKSTIDSITMDGVNNSATKIIPKGSLIVATRMAVGKVAICEIDVAINQDLKAVDVIGEVNIFYLLYLFKTKEKYFDSISSGATVKGIKIEHITKLETILPSIQRQRQFAERVQTIEAQKALAQQSLEKSEELFNSLLQKAFKGELV